MPEIAQFRSFQRKALGWFLEFRLIPVLLWSFTSVVLGTALAAHDQGTVDPWLLGVALALSGLVQGWVTHSVNEIYDWRSGTDRHARPRALSGGSKVQNLGLLTERDLWIIFAVSSGGVAILALYAGWTRAAWLLLLILAGYVLGVLYTLPPVATAYRPFLGEWLGGFPGVLLAVPSVGGIWQVTNLAGWLEDRWMVAIGDADAGPGAGRRYDEAGPTGAAAGYAHATRNVGRGRCGPGVSSPRPRGPGSSRSPCPA